MSGVNKCKYAGSKFIHKFIFEIKLRSNSLLNRLIEIKLITQALNS